MPGPRKATYAAMKSSSRLAYAILLCAPLALGCSGTSSSPADAGSDADSGVLADAGLPDSAQIDVDAGTTVDGSAGSDSGIDAGIRADSGVDAGPPIEDPCDRDRDRYVAALCGGNDCDDTRADVHPLAVELCTNGVDDDCNGRTDAADAACVGRG